jgi:cytochrome oxidase Cu insertion factor (SCO1/SenC/PrrC family)
VTAKLFGAAALGSVFGVLLAILLVPAVRWQVLGAPMVISGTAQIGGPFVLQDHRGKRTTDQDLRGAYALVFFGYTRSPDITPAALQVMTSALADLGALRTRIRPVLITIDPAHDTPARMSEFLARYDANMQGLTGLPADIEAVKRAYHVAARPLDATGDAAAERFAYAPLFFLMGPDGRYVAHFDDVANGRQLAIELRKLL